MDGVMLPVMLCSIVVCGGLGLALGNLMREPLGGLLFGAAFGPLGVAYLAVKYAVTSQKGTVAGESGTPDQGSKKCPFCAEKIRIEATLCRFCHREQPSGAVAPEALMRHQ